MTTALLVPLATGCPVIPQFGRGDECVRTNGKFRFHWFINNFGDGSCPAWASTSR